MKFIKKYFKGRRIFTTILSLVMIMLSSAVIIAANNSTVKNFLNASLNIKTYEVENKADNKFYKKDNESGPAAQQKLRDLNININDEGIVMLKNDDNALPLVKGSKISAFGYVSTHLISGGTGSGVSKIENPKLLKESLEAVGFGVNAKTQEFYEKTDASIGYIPSTMDKDVNGQQFRVGEVSPTTIPNDVKNTYKDYNVALYVIGRLGGEGADLPRQLTNDSAQVKFDARDLNKHALELMENEKDTLKHLNDNFDKVILVINSSSAFELGFLKEAAYNKVKAALFIGGPGENGIKSLGRILSGDANPSGKLADTFVYDMFTSPSNFNFGSFDYKNVKNTDYNGHFVEYNEGIYVGYRYYETRGFSDGEAWYNQNVQFPFGYGLSYTTFKYEVEGTPGGNITKSDQLIEIKVKVTNTGSVTGKEVVQLYYTAPYNAGKIEKAHVNLADFAKTGILKPGESETLTLKVVADAMSSYDYNDKNENGFKGYELEAGTYKLSLRNNAHNVLNEGALSYDYNLDTGYKLTDSITHGKNVKNVFDDISGYMGKVLSRNDWTGTMPTTPGNDKTVSKELKKQIENPKKIQIAIDPNAKVFKFGQKLDKFISFAEMRGVAYDDAKWDQFISQIPLKEAIYLLGANAYWIREVPSVNKPKSWSLDGPVGLNQPFVGAKIDDLYPVKFGSGVVVAQTWNKKLAYDFGVGNGELALHTSDQISGWYAPGVNIHRSQFGGRNFEYFSEDGVLSGVMAAEISKGAQTKGLYTYVKHFAFNDQETYRMGVSTWFEEQTAREIYLRPFAIAVRDGKTQAIMSSFNRIGGLWAGSHKGLLTDVLRKEWGFVGMVKTDFFTPTSQAYANYQLMLNAGGDNILGMAELDIKDKTSATATNDLKNAVKNTLYVTINSNLSNIVSKDTIVTSRGTWQWWWYTTIHVVFVPVCLISVGVLVRSGIKIKKELSEE